LPIAEDPANADERFDRARVRRLLARGGLDAKAAARSAACLAEAEAALCWAVDRAWDSRVEIRPGESRLDLEGLPDEISRRLLARALESFGATPRGAAVARLLVQGGGTVAGVRATAKANAWRLTLAPARGRRRD
jgi:tRNA(Ile)-lysidine synthase